MTTTNITKGIREIESPKLATIHLTSDGAKLSGEYADGEVFSHSISNKVAEVLIAQGMSYGS